MRGHPAPTNLAHRHLGTRVDLLQPAERGQAPRTLALQGPHQGSPLLLVIVPEPKHEVPNSVSEIRPGAVAREPLQKSRVRPGGGYIAGLDVRVVPDGLLAEGVLDRLDEVEKPHFVGVADVHDPEGGQPNTDWSAGLLDCRRLLHCPPVDANVMGAWYPK